MEATFKRWSTAAQSERIHFRSTFEKHGTFVCRRLRSLGVQEADLDDALQEVFLVVFQRAQDYEERGRIRGWLTSICTRVAWTRTRAKRRRYEDLVDYPEHLMDPTQHDRMADHESLALGQRLLQALPPEQSDVFWLYEVEEHSMPEIARMLGCPLQTAYSRLHKARERILAAVRLAGLKDAHSARSG